MVIRQKDRIHVPDRSRSGWFPALQTDRIDRNIL